MKFSIMLPCHNGMPYIKTAVDLILRQNYDDFELIISDDHSTDGTSEYIDSLSDFSHVKILHCPTRESMSEHWEYAQSFASGDWQIFVGQDDGLQGYFFELAEKLVFIAEAKKLAIIMSERAYYFWHGCENAYGTSLLDYSAENTIKILNSKKELKKALYKTKISYMDLPSMYTTSLFSKHFIDSIKQKNGGHLFITHPQDANLAAYACLLTNRYLKSYIPLGWVGTSSSSAGLAIIELCNNETALGKEYFDTIKQSPLPYHKLAYDFRIPSLNLYFWNALLCVTEKTNMQKEHNFLINRNTKIHLFSFMQTDAMISGLGRQLFNELLSINNISVNDLKNLKTKKIIYLFYPIKKVLNILLRKKIKKYSLVLDKEISDISLLKADSYVSNKVKKELL